MEENERLLTLEGGGGEQVLAPTEMGENRFGSFLRRFVEVVALRGNKDYTGDMLHDLELVLLERGEMKEARSVAMMELDLRRSLMNREMSPIPLIGQLVNNGTINDVHNNKEVKQPLAL